MNWILELPAVNATLNGASAALLIAGYLSIRRKRVALHKALMLSALAASTLFLASYLTYHANAESPKFPGRGWVRPAYFAMLLSHIVLAAGLVPMALVTLIAALRGRIEKHRRLARWTLPIWMYVSLTGVLVYVVLYGVYGASPTLKSAALFTTP
ncbi:MAG: DUF420 domain-containing protein [Phycisphaerales bacterium]|nr:DUF420 domain-containing protein [Phycisphaerales bacterium]